MAYNGKHHLQKIIDIQNIYLKYKEEGVTATFIYLKYIYPVYRISRSTFYNYMGRNAKHELTMMLKAEENKKKQKRLQGKLF